MKIYIGRGVVAWPDTDRRVLSTDHLRLLTFATVKEAEGVKGEWIARSSVYRLNGQGRTRRAALRSLEGVLSSHVGAYLEAGEGVPGCTLTAVTSATKALGAVVGFLGLARGEDGSATIAVVNVPLRPRS